MTVALLLDEMIGPKVAIALRRRSVDVYGIVERPDLHSLPDDDVLTLAASERRMVVTFNIHDFARLDHGWKSAGRTHAGIVMLSTATFPQNRGQLGALVRALRAAVDQQILPAPDAVTYLRPVAPSLEG